MKSTASPDEFLLTASQRRIIDLVRRHGPVSRAELVGLSGLGPASVTLLTRELLERNLMLEAGRRSGGRGQPAIELLINSDAAYSIGVSFSSDSLIIAILDFGGTRRGEHVIENKFTTFEDAISAVQSIVATLIGAHNLAHSNCAGIGLAVTGNFEAGRIVLHPPNGLEQWQGTDFAERMSTTFKVPIFIENDANAATIAETLIGNPSGFRSFFYLFLSDGIGGGMVIEGTPWRGTSGNCGEMGALVPRPERRPSLDDLRIHLSKFGHINLKSGDMARLYEKSPDIFVEWLDIASAKLSELILFATAVADPDGIIIGGRLPPALFDELSKRVSFAPDMVGRRMSLSMPPVKVSPLSGELAAALGAATLPFSNGQTAQLPIETPTSFDGIQNTGS